MVHFLDYKSVGKQDLYYTDVSIKDVGSGELLEGEKWDFHKSIYHYEKQYVDLGEKYDVNINRASEVYLELECIINPECSSAVILQESSDFELILSSQVQEKTNSAWRIFSYGNIGMVRLIEQDRSKKGFLTKKYHISLTDKLAGYVQFCSTSPQLYNGVFYEKGRILTVFIYKNHHTYVTYPFPPVLTVVPRTTQTYVPLRSHQMMQLITLYNQHVEHVGEDHVAFKFEYKEQCCGDYLSYFYSAKKNLDKNETICVTKDGKNIKAVIVPGVREFENNTYPVIFNPLKDFTLYCYNIKGFLLMISSETDREFEGGKGLDCDGELLIQNFIEQKNLKCMLIEFQDKDSVEIMVENLYTQQCKVHKVKGLIYE